MAQRLMVARSIAHRPHILFLDEPTAGLDPQSRLALWEILHELHGDGLTVLLTTHYMEEADHLCDRVAIMDHGRVLALDTPLALKASVNADTVAQVTKTATPPSLRAAPGYDRRDPRRARRRLGPVFLRRATGSCRESSPKPRQQVFVSRTSRSASRPSRQSSSRLQERICANEHYSDCFRYPRHGLRSSSSASFAAFWALLLRDLRVLEEASASLRSAPSCSRCCWSLCSPMCSRRSGRGSEVRALRVASSRHFSWPAWCDLDDLSGCPGGGLCRWSRSLATRVRSTTGSWRLCLCGPSRSRRSPREPSGAHRRAGRLSAGRVSSRLRRYICTCIGSTSSP